MLSKRSRAAEVILRICCVGTFLWHFFFFHYIFTHSNSPSAHSTSFVLNLLCAENLCLHWSSTSPSACSGMRHKHSAIQFKVGGKAVAEQWLHAGITEHRNPSNLSAVRYCFIKKVNSSYRSVYLKYWIHVNSKFVILKLILFSPLFYPT